MASRRAALAPLSDFSTSAGFAFASASSSLQDGHRFANPGLPGFSSNSSPQTAQVLIGNAIIFSYKTFTTEGTEAHRVPPHQFKLIQKILAVQGVALGRTESGVANNPAQFFFGGAVGHARGAHHVFFQHD